MISIQIIMRIQQLDYFLLKFDVKIDQYLNKYWHFDRNTHDFVKKRDFRNQDGSFHVL